MDLTAFTLCMERTMDVVVFNIWELAAAPNRFGRTHRYNGSPRQVEGGMSMAKHEPNPPMTPDALFKDAETRMKHAIEHLQQDLAGYRTGRANPAMVERLMVDYHGTPMQLQHLASITVPEPRQLLIQPWDQSRGVCD
jgi:ribosome recycling factor